jgi:hypothetical protein
MNVKMAGFDAQREAEELARRQREILEGYGYRLHEGTGKAYKFVPVPEDFFVVSDGGRRESGDTRVTEFHGTCVVRSFAIAQYGPHPTGAEYHQTYREICDAIRDWALAGKSNALKRLYRDGTRHCKPDHMPHNDVVSAYAESKGFVWTATAGIGQVETVHVRPDELPGGSLVLKISKAYTAMVDGVLYDTWDTSVSRHVSTDDGRGWRMVYGYYTAP